MAGYGVDYYGASLYGLTSFVQFSVAPFVARPFAYGTVRLQWSSPTGSWTRIRLVRNSYGFPITELDGTTLFDLNAGPDAVGDVVPEPAVYDDDNLTQGSFYYYAMFVYSTTSAAWFPAGVVTVLAPKDYGYTDKMLSRIPSVFTTQAQEMGGHSDSGTVLERFLSVLGFDLDFTRTIYDTLLHIHDPDKVSGGLLPLLSEQFGMVYEPEIGMRQSRIMLRNVMTIRKRKGTALAVEAFVSSFTGWGAGVAQGKNILLNTDDSSFELSTGGWSALSFCAVGHAPAAEVEPFTSSSFYNQRSGSLRITTDGGDTATVQLGLVDEVVTTGIPVTGGAPYTLSGYARAGQVQTRPTNLILDWYDQRGVFISSAIGATVDNVFGVWSARPTVSEAAPASATYLLLRAQVAGVPDAGEVHYLDGIQLEEGTDATDFQEARSLQIILDAERINEVPNPSAEIDLRGWTGDANTTLERSTDRSYSGRTDTLTPTLAQKASFLLTAIADGDVTAVSDPIPVLPTTPYTLSAYLSSASTSSGRVSLLWYDADSVLLGTSTGASEPVEATAWTRPAVSTISPAGAATCRVYVIGEGLLAGGTVSADAVLLESDIRMRPYFDGGTNPAFHMWEVQEEGAHFSRSHHYHHRGAKDWRLRLVLPDYLPLGTPFDLLYAQPGLT